MSSLSGRTNNNKNIPKFPNDIGTAGQFIKLKSDVNDGFEYVDVVDFSLPIASSNTLGGVKINGGNLAITNDGLLSSTNTEYTAGTNISITDEVISATNTEYTAGSNISITDEVISATNTEYTAGSNISITDEVISATVPTLTSQLTNNSGFITDASNINNTLIQTTRQEIIGDTQPQLYIRPSATSGRDATLTLEGRRNNNSNINTTYLKFTNFDDNDGANGSTAIVGIICGAVSNAADNTGRLRFYTSSTGSNSALCLSLDSDNSATFYGNVTFSNTPKDSSNYSYITTHSTNTLLNKSFTYDSISDPPSIPSGNELLPTVSSTAGQVLEVYEVSSGVYGRRWVDLPVVDTCFNRFSTNACDSVALYGKIAQVSSDTYQEVLTELQYTGGGLGAAAYLSDNLGDFTNNVGFITTLPSNLPNFNEALTSSITDGKLLRVGQDSNNNKVIKYESDTNKLVPDITTDGYFLRSDIAGTTQSLTWAEIPSIPTNSPNFNESLTSSITDGDFLRVGTSGGNKVIKYETVDVIEDLTSYTQPGAISINTDSTLSLKQNSQTRIQIPDVGSANSAGRVDLLLGKYYASASSTGQGELRFTRADTDDVIYSRHHSIYTQHYAASSPELNLMKFSIHNGATSGTTQVDALTLNGSGMVGIGDVTPLHGKLQVGGDIFACSEPITGGNTGNANVICKQLRIYADNENLMIGANNSQLKIRGASSNGIGFYGTNQSQGNEYMRITDRTYDNTTAGNIGIGLINPTEKLEVNGTVKATDFKFPITGGGTFLVSNLYNNYVTLDTAVGTVTNTVNNLDIPNLTSFSQVAEISLTSTGNSIKLRTGPTTRLEVGNDGNVSIGGNLTCGSYAGLPIAGTADYGIVLIGGASSGLSVSTGVLSANSTTLVETGSSALMTSGGIASLELVSVATALEVQFKLYLVQEMNVNSKDYNWNQSGTTIGSESVYSEGIALVQGGAEFRCTKAGTFTISFLIVCDNGASNNRASFYTKVVKKFSGSEVKDYYVGGNTYYRDNDNNYDEICLCATINLTLKVNESFLIRSIRLFSEGSGSIPTHSSSELTIERVDQRTVVSSSP